MGPPTRLTFTPCCCLSHTLLLPSYSLPELPLTRNALRPSQRSSWARSSSTSCSSSRTTTRRSRSKSRPIRPRTMTLSRTCPPTCAATPSTTSSTRSREKARGTRSASLRGRLMMPRSRTRCSTPRPRTRSVAHSSASPARSKAPIIPRLLTPKFSTRSRVEPPRPYLP